MKRFVLRIARAALILVTLSNGPQTVFGEVIFNNLGDVPLGDDGFSGTQDLRAQQFQTTATGYVLDSVTVKVSNTSSATGNFSVSVYSDSSNDPGTSLGVFATRSWIGIGTSSENVTLNGLMTLSPSTTYFMVMSVDSVSNGSWVVTSTDPGAGLVDRFSTDSGASWLANNDFPQMQVTAVPEPAVWTLGASGLVAWWGLQRRRQRQRALRQPAALR